MADGDTYTLTHGRYKGATRVAIDKTTATTHILVPKVASKTIRVHEAYILIEGAGSTANIQEEGSSAVIYGAIEAITGSTATQMKIDESDGVFTATENKDLELVLSVTLPISGWVIYSTQPN